MNSPAFAFKVFHRISSIPSRLEDIPWVILAGASATGGVAMRLQRSTWQGRTAGLVLAAMAALIGGACDLTSSLQPSRTPGELSSNRGQPPSDTLQTSPTPYRVSGQVTDEAGRPIVDAVVEVDHGRFWAPMGCSACFVATRTNGHGEYTLEVEPLQNALAHPYVYAFSDGYETTVQWVPAEGPLRVQNLELRRARPIRSGESTSASVGPESSLCTDLEDWWLLDYRCEVVQVESAAGTLVVDVRAADGSGPAQLFSETSGSYTGVVTRPSPTVLSIPAGGGTYRIFVGIPEGAPTTLFEVATSLR